MSISAPLGSTSPSLPSVDFHSHGHHRGGPIGAGGATVGQSGSDPLAAASGPLGSTGASGIGDLPVGAVSSLFSQLIAALTPTAATASSTSSTASPAAAAASSAIPSAGSAAANGTIGARLNALA